MTGVGSGKQPGALVIHRAVISPLSLVLMEQGEEGFGYWCGRVPDLDRGSRRGRVDVVEGEVIRIPCE
jgi:hypothetical protein